MHVLLVTALFLRLAQTQACSTAEPWLEVDAFSEGARLISTPVVRRHVADVSPARILFDFFFDDLDAQSGRIGNR